MRLLILLSLLAMNISAFAKPEQNGKPSALPPDVLDVRPGETINQAAERACLDKLGSPAQAWVFVKAAREQAFANVLANATSSSLEKKGATNFRCFHPIYYFDSFLKGSDGRVGYFAQNLADELLDGNGQPWIWLPDGTRAQLNCAAAVNKSYPDLMTMNEKIYEDTIQELIQQPAKLRDLVNRALSGKMKLVNYPKAVVQEINKIEGDPTCVQLKLYSPESKGGYGYGRAFKVCADSKRTTCENYYAKDGDNLQTILDLDSKLNAKWESDPRYSPDRASQSSR